MYSTFLALETARRAILAHQKALEVVGHNIANASTPGYVRREAVLQATPPHVTVAGSESARPGAVGTGVEVARIKRIFDGFLEGRIRRASITLGYWEGREQALMQIEGLFSEPSDVGLGEELSKFFSAWDDLSKRPEGGPLRTALVEEAKILAAQVNRLIRGLRELARDMDAEMAAKVSEINSLTEEIAAQNREIVKITAVGNDPGDLKDKRDLAIAHLSKLIDVTAFETQGGSVVIQLGARDLVREGMAHEVVFEPGTLPGEPIAPGDFKGSRLIWDSDSTTVDIRGGEVAATLEARAATVPSYYREIELLVTTLSDKVNELHRAGYGIDAPPTTGVDFFIYDSAKRVLRVNPLLDPESGGDVSKIAAAATENEGDGGIAFAIAGLKDALTMNGGTVSLRGFYQHIIARIGVDTRNSSHTVEVHEATYRQCLNSKDSLSGVSIDEELVNLVRYQRAYQAASRVFTTIDEMLDTIINRTGIVGR